MNHNNSNITNINEYRANQMPDASGFNINEPGIPVEFVSQDFVNNYIQANSNNTPDLWSRIEAGFEVEAENIRASRRRKSAATKKIVGFVAAAALITIIAVPTMMLGMGGSKNEECTTEAIQEMYHDEVSNSVVMEAPSDGVAIQDVQEESQAESPSSLAADAEAESTVTNDSYAEGGETLKQLEEIQGIQTDTRQIVVEGEFVFDGNENKVSLRIKNISDNQYKEIVVDIGDEIMLSNSMYILSMDVMVFEGKITFDSVKIDDLGNITGRIIDLEYIKSNKETESTVK